MFSSEFSLGMVSWDYEPPIGGMGRHVRSLTKVLGEKGMRVSVFSRSDLPWLRFGRNIVFSILLLVALPRWIRKHRLTLLHVHTGPGGVLLLSRPARVPLVVTANHTYAQQSRIKGQRWKRLFIPFERRTYALADAILCLSEDTARSVEHDYGMKKSKLAIVGCGVDLNRCAYLDTSLPERQKCCLFIGRHDSRKGFDLLRAAWDSVRKNIPNAHLHVVGWDERSTDAIAFHGRLSDGELRTFQTSVRCVVVPSRLEGFGLAAAESICAGTPVVATDADGLRSVVENDATGLLTSPDPADIAAGLSRMLSDDALWERLHAGCRSVRSSFDLAAEADKHLAIYRTLY